ncbi:hypothetical protein pEaSNUABM23_00058 [Erwinia phage pEa_SNUABM_23]|nr:hypothetical protein pEaSNUABM20_00059 [Erwinia phage pEa_SNUABM_20]UAW52840.1 hypothetical protein pEaSNUABM23_00058 [Erwinia phage pEa_SNUABM_23]UIW10736.1 hypothetical protein pEaSNUABM23_00058 [Erwinia phage pEa_SNUABM_31]
MIKRLLAWFARSKTQPKKTFEEKLDDVAGVKHDNSLAAEIRRDDEQLRRALHPGYQPIRREDDPKVVDFPTRRYQTQRSADRPKPLNRGMTVNQHASSRAATDDLAMAMMMRQTFVAPSPIVSYDDDCRNTHHTPSHGGYDSPSDGGGSSDGGGGGSCD